MTTKKPEDEEDSASSVPAGAEPAAVDVPAHDLDPSKPSIAAELGGATSDDPANLVEGLQTVDDGTPPDERQPEDKP